MNEQCNKCYWKALADDKCLKNLRNYNNKCKNFLGYCDKCDEGNEEEYEYKGEKYCKSCLMEKLEMKVETVEYYTTSDGEYLGDENDVMLDIFQDVESDVEKL